MNPIKKEQIKLEKITDNILNAINNRDNITDSDLQSIIEVQVHEASNAKNDLIVELNDRITEARHLMAMLCETIEVLDPTFYTSSDLILYSDDWERIVAHEIDIDDEEGNAEYDYLANLRNFIATNSSLDINN